MIMIIFDAKKLIFAFSIRSIFWNSSSMKEPKSSIDTMSNTVHGILINIGTEASLFHACVITSITTGNMPYTKYGLMQYL